MIWVAIIAGLVLLILLIIFILQNEDRVTVHYLGFSGELSLGMALFIASVAGGVVVAIAGAARILQLRTQRRRSQSSSPEPKSSPESKSSPEPKSSPELKTEPASTDPKGAPTVPSPQASQASPTSPEPGTAGRSRPTTGP
jgi:uncharacterized integral membrane protein